MRKPPHFHYPFSKLYGILIDGIFGRNFLEFPVGTACIADVQFKGRGSDRNFAVCYFFSENILTFFFLHFKGRAKNVWESPAGCLMFSFTLQMEDGRKVPLLQYIVSLAVTEAIKECCQVKVSSTPFSVVVLSSQNGGKLV